MERWGFNKERKTTMIKEIDRLYIPAYNWNPSKKEYHMKPCVGLDTETVDGKATLIMDSLGNRIVPTDADDVFAFLTNIKYRHSFNWFFNLDYDTRAIIRWLPEDVIKQFRQDKIRQDRAMFGEFEITHIPKKLLKIKNIHTRNVCTYYDISQFYRPMSLDEASFKYLNQHKLEPNRDLSALTLQDMYSKDIQKYCFQDCVLTERLAKRFVDLVFKFVGVRGFMSAASIAQEYVSKRINFDLDLTKMPNQYLDLALKSYNGGRFEVTQRGSFKDCKLYDINSAYPYEISQLTPCSNNIIFNQDYREDANHSFFKTIVDIPEDTYLSPAIVSDKTIIYPTGKHEQYLTKKELEYYMKNDIDFEIIKAVHDMGDDQTKVFHWITKLYERRLEMKKDGDPQEKIIKLIQNSIYGKMLQMVPNGKIEVNHISPFFDLNTDTMIATYYDSCYRTGKLFNPMWGSEIAAGCRLKLLNDIRHKDVISIATDGVIVKKKQKVKVGEQLGEYTMDKGDALVIGSGVYKFGDKTKLRGFDTKTDLIDLLDKTHKGTVVTYSKTRPLTRNAAIIQHRISEMNVFMEFVRTLNLNFDSKRAWIEDFQDVRDVFDSQHNSAPLHPSTP